VQGGAGGGGFRQAALAGGFFQLSRQACELGLVKRPIGIGQRAVLGAGNLDPARRRGLKVEPGVAHGFLHDEAFTRWVKTVVLAEQLFRCVAETQPCSAFRNSMSIVAR
jgi:hypothetical protein